MSKQIVYGSVERKIVSSDLIEERAKKDFNGSIEEVLHGENYQRAKDALAFMEAHPELHNSHKFYEMTRQE